MKAKSLLPRRTCRGILAAAQAIIALGLWTANLTAAAAVQKRATHNRNAETYYLLVFSNPVAGREDEYNKWYDGKHLADVTSVPGFVSGQRYVVNAAQLRDDAKPPRKYLAIYKIVTDDLASVFAEVNRRIDAGITVMSPAYDRSNSLSYTYKVIRPMVEHSGHTPDPAAARPQAYYQLVFTNPVPGREDEYNKWYDERHVPDVVGVPGFVNAQRLAASEVQLNRKNTEIRFRYLVMYKILSDDVASVIATFKQRSPTMVMSPAFGPSEGYTYKAIGRFIDGDKVRADRAEKSH
jgi:hypothetical protein